MRKKDDPRVPTSEMAVVVFRLKGADQTVQDGIKTISQAVHSMLKPLALPVRHGAAPLASSDQDEEGEIIDIPQGEDNEAPVQPLPPRASKPRKTPTYSFVKDLNLRPPNKESMKDFYAKKSPASAQEQVTVILYYLKHVLECEKVGPNHLYTAFKEVGVAVPQDIAHTARLTANRKGWIDTSKADDLKVVPSGENFVEHELGKAKSKTAE